MKRIDLRIYIDDQVVEVPNHNVEQMAQSLTTVVIDAINTCCEPHVPKDTIRVFYAIDNNADPNDLFL